MQVIRRDLYKGVAGRAVAVLLNTSSMCGVAWRESISPVKE